MRERTDYGGLDVFRIVAALLVVEIHTSPFTSYSAGADFFLTRVLARVAVPFFLMVTGHFVLSDVVTRSARPGTEDRWLGSVKKILILYLISTLIYIPVGIYAGHYRGIGVLELLRMVVFDGTFYHLWYFPACAIGMCIVALSARRMSVRGLAVLTGGLYLIGLLGDSYYGLTEQSAVLSHAYDWGFHVWSYTRNGLFLTPVFLFLGAVIGSGESRREESDRHSETVIRVREDRRGVLSGRISEGRLLAWGLISFLLMTLEAFALRAAGWQRHDCMYVMLVPVMYFLYRLLLSLRWENRRNLRTTAMLIYILHPMMIVLIRAAARLLHMSILVDNSLVHYLVVAAGTFLVSQVRVHPEKRGRRNQEKRDRPEAGGPEA